MIRVGIVEKDPMVCQILEEIIVRLDGCEIVGKVPMLGMVTETVDLIIGEYTANEMAIWFSKRDIRLCPVDFIPITAVREYSEYRCFVRLGVMDYILKPFERKRVEKALHRYQKWRYALLPDADLTQKKLDAFYYPGMIQNETGICEYTLYRIQQYIAEAKKGYFTAREAALEMKMSPVTMRRYLEYMHKTGLLKMIPQYGNVGRPSYQYYMKREEKENEYDDCSNTESGETA
jgi:response regulator of citrate/malate metabolism